MQIRHYITADRKDLSDTASDKWQAAFTKVRYPHSPPKVQQADVAVKGVLSGDLPCSILQTWSVLSAPKRHPQQPMKL